MHEEGIEYPGLEGFRVITTDADALVEVQIAPAAAPSADAEAIERRWRALCATNARLHDGPVLSVVSISHEPDRRTGCGMTTVRARRGSYKHLAVQCVAGPAAPEPVETETDQLSVTAIVQGLDAARRPHVLLGRRGEQTRIYGGRWELGPSGGVNPPRETIDRLTEEDLVRQVLEEIDEELGGAVRADVMELRAITYDPAARSYDLCFLCEVRGTIAPGHAAPETWEYGESRWLPIHEVAAFDREHAGTIIGPTRALFRFMGWS